MSQKKRSKKVKEVRGYFESFDAINIISWRVEAELDEYERFFVGS